MFSSRIILPLVFIFATAFSAQAQKREAKDWSIADYFKNLPEKYITTYGDYANGQITVTCSRKIPFVNTSVQLLASVACLFHHG